MDSLQKIHAFVNDASEGPGPDAGAFELTFRTAAMSLGPMFLAELPEDPRVLDEALTKMALRLLAMRSDDCDVVEVREAGTLLLELPSGG